MKALIIGATGATGSDLLQLLLNDSEVESVDVFVRRDLGVEHSKINVHIIDFEKSEEWKHLVKGDVLFSCLGTTLKDAGSKEAQWKVDYDYQYLFAKAARENGVGCYVLVSAMNASSKSKIFYSRMKGKLDDDVSKLGFPKLLIFKPPSLIRKRSNRKMEKMGINVINFFNRLGLLKSLKPMPTYTLAKEMLDAVRNAITPDNIADPSVSKFGDTYYLYGTTDIDRGLEKMGPPVVWKSKDFVNWRQDT